MDIPPKTTKRVLVLSFSFSSQTNNLVHALISGMAEYDISIVREKLVPVEPLRFPIGSYGRTFRMMMETFLRKRMPIKPLDPQCFGDFDLTIVAGPTWSYNPSGPVLSLFDRYGKQLFKDRLVLPLISCRGYWRFHWFGLKKLFCTYRAKVVNVIVFSHPNPEPWRTIGVFLKLAGRLPEKKSFFRDKYPKYGHSRKQLTEAKRFGGMIGEELVQNGRNLHLLNFETEVAQP